VKQRMHVMDRRPAVYRQSRLCRYGFIFAVAGTRILAGLGYGRVEIKVGGKISK